MSTELIKQDSNNKLTYTSEQIALIKSQIAPKATDNELKLFLYQCQRTGLDALSRQIYAIHRKQKQGDTWIEKMSIQTSIDGFRVIAERSGDYAGQDEPLFEEVDGKPIVCKVRVFRFRGEVRYPAAVGVAYWDEYVQRDFKTGQPSGLWAKMPHTMLAKVAEALALRKAYPQDLSGLYTGDEMEQTENIAHEEVKLNGTTSSHNHTTLGTAQKPLISNLQFKNLCERVGKGDVKAYYAGVETFTFEATQKRVLEEIFAGLIDKEPLKATA